jgi:tetratricopeptide (TPR) repeat protein
MSVRRPGGYRLLGSELRRLRGHRSLRQIEDLSHSPPFNSRVEPLSASTLQKIEAGERKLRLDTLLTLSAIYRIPPERLFTLIQVEGLWELRPPENDFDQLHEEAVAAYRMGDHRKCYAWSLRLEELASNGRERAIALHNKGISLWKLGLPREGATELTEMLGDPDLDHRTRATAWLNLSAIYRSLWNLPVARTHAETARELVLKIGSLELQGHVERVLGNIKSDLGETAEGHDGRLFREALKHYDRSNACFEKAGMPEHVPPNTVNMGVAHILDGNRLLGFRMLHEGLDRCRESGSQQTLAFALKELGKAYGSTDDWERGRRYLIEAEAIAAAQGYHDLQFQALYHLLEAERADGNSGGHVLRRLTALKPFVQSRFPEIVRFEEGAEPLVAEGGAR